MRFVEILRVGDFESWRGVVIMMGWELDIYHKSWRGIMIMMGWVLGIGYIS